MNKTCSLITGLSLGTYLLLAAPAVGVKPWNQWRNALAPHGSPGPELTLANDGKTNYTIVIPVAATTQDTKAAEDLAHWLKAMTTAAFPVMPDTKPPREHEISVGRTSRLAAANLPAAHADLGDEGYAIAIKNQKLFLLGGKKRGPINAVYALLEEDLGCRWYTADVDRIPAVITLRSKPVPRSFTPVLRIRDPFYKVAFDSTFSLQNRTNAPSAAVPEEWGGRIDYALFVHTVHTLVPPSQYFEKHPEYFMQEPSGKRNAHQLCMTNPDAIRVATESALQILAEHPHSEIISVSKTDGGRTCVCDTCKSLDDAEGSNAASLLHFVNKVAEAVEGKYPHVVISTLAYLETVKPPKTIRPRENVAIRLCTDKCMWAHPFTPARQSPVFSEALTSWAKIHHRIHIWDYCVNFSHYTAPMPNMDVVADNIRYFVENNAKGVMEQGAYQSPAAERDRMRAWVMAKLMWDPSRDVRELINDFTWGYYGPAAPAIAEYEELLAETAKSHSDSLKAPEGGIRYGMDAPFLSREFIDKATAAFDRAEQLATDEQILQRVQEARLPVMYVKLCRGRAVVGNGYSTLIDRFEKIARRQGLTHIYEGPPDLDKKLEQWRKAAVQ